MSASQRPSASRILSGAKPTSDSKLGTPTYADLRTYERSLPARASEGSGVAQCSQSQIVLAGFRAALPASHPKFSVLYKLLDVS